MLRSAPRAELIQHAFEPAQQVVVGDHVDDVFALASVHTSKSAFCRSSSRPLSRPMMMIPHGLTIRILMYSGSCELYCSVSFFSTVSLQR